MSFNRSFVAKGFIIILFGIGFSIFLGLGSFLGSFLEDHGFSGMIILIIKLITSIIATLLLVFFGGRNYTDKLESEALNKPVNFFESLANFFLLVNHAFSKPIFLIATFFIVIINFIVWQFIFFGTP